MKCKLTYQETLDIVEKFMIDSGIRKYCTEVCKGGCCMDCYHDNPNACHLQEGRRLTCSIYVCYDLRQKFSKRTSVVLNNIHYDIYEQYSIDFDLYFDVPDKTFLETVRFPISIEKDLRKISIKRVRNTMNKLIKTKEKIYRH